MKLRRSFYVILIIVLLILVCLGRLQILFTRFIDPDEFAHLHWAYLISIGKLPYKDFFFYITPLYQWFLSPVFLLPLSPALIIIARLWQYVIYLAVLYLIFSITKIFINSRKVSLLATLIMSVFPMTFDKTIDVRPDMLMIFFFLLCVYILIKNKFSQKSLIFSGALYSLALLILPKIIFALPALFYLFITKLLQKPNNWGFIKALLYIILGMILPVIFLTLYFLVNNLLPQALQSIFIDSVAVNTGKASFSLLLALSPWPLVYVDSGGFSLPWAVNLALFILSVPGLYFLWRLNLQASIFFLIFIVCKILFLILFPVPYLQYFLTFTPFISILAALMIYNIINLSRKYSLNHLITFIVLSILLWSFFIQYRIRNTPSNNEQLKVIADILNFTKPNETVYDMVGSYLFRPDGYFICCHPYSEFINKLKNPFPSLSQSLEKTQTKFLVMDRTGLLFWKPTPNDYQFLISNYLPSKYRKIFTLGHQYRCIRNSCQKIGAEGNPLPDASSDTFEIIIPETYKISISPSNMKAIIDGKEISEGSYPLSKGNHSLVLPENISSLTIQLDR